MPNERQKNDEPEPRQRTLDELAHETAESMMSDLPFGQRVGVVIVSGLTSNGARTVWRFIHCNDPQVQATTLRQIADLIEQTASERPG